MELSLADSCFGICVFSYWAFVSELIVCFSLIKFDNHPDVNLIISKVEYSIMLMINNHIPLFTLITAIFCLTFIHCNNNEPKVPLILWSMNSVDDGGQLSSPPQSLIDEVYPEDLLQMYPDSGRARKVAFIQKDINVEQFSQSSLPYLSRLFEENDAVCLFLPPFGFIITDFILHYRCFFLIQHMNRNFIIPNSTH